MPTIKVGERKWWMGALGMGAVFLAGIAMLVAGKMNDTTFGLWIGGLAVDFFGYGASNLIAAKIANGKKK